MNNFSSDNLNENSLQQNLCNILPFCKVLVDSIIALDGFRDPILELKLKGIKDALNAADETAQKLLSSNLQSPNMRPDKVSRKRNASNLKCKKVKFFRTEDDCIQAQAVSKFSQFLKQKELNFSDEKESIVEVRSDNFDSKSQCSISSSQDLSCLINDLNPTKKSHMEDNKKINFMKTPNKPRDLTVNNQKSSVNDFECEKKNETQSVCYYCLKPADNNEIADSTCGHKIHNDCLKMYLKEKMNLLRPKLQCKMNRCRGIIPCDKVRKYLDDSTERTIYEF